VFLSKIIFDRRRWDVVHDLEDRDRLHKKLLRPFPDYPGGGCDNARELMGVLFRVEERFIILQSKIAPNAVRMAPGYMIEGTKDVTENYASIRERAVYRFRLDANTSIAVRGEDDGDWVPNADSTILVRTKSKRVGCGNYQARSRWFERKFELSGFSAVDFSMDALPFLHLRGGALEVTRFEGRLRVDRLDTFLKALHRGVGRAKAFGLGLLSIRNA
jgi:CRISPR system Cascade subunit CasE